MLNKNTTKKTHKWTQNIHNILLQNAEIIVALVQIVVSKVQRCLKNTVGLPVS